DVVEELLQEIATSVQATPNRLRDTADFLLVVHSSGRRGRRVKRNLFTDRVKRRQGALDVHLEGDAVVALPLSHRAAEHHAARTARDVANRSWRSTGARALRFQ